MEIDLETIKFPPGFIDFLVEEADPDLLFDAIPEIPELQSVIFKGFSLSRTKIQRIITQPKISLRMKNLAKHSKVFIEFLIEVWGEKNSSQVAFLNLLTSEFLCNHFVTLKNLIGPCAFFCMLYNSKFREFYELPTDFGEDFWKQTKVSSLPEFLRPVLEVSEWICPSFNFEPPMSPSGSGKIVEKIHEEGGRKKAKTTGKKAERQIKKQQEIINKLERQLEKLKKKLEAANKLNQEYKNQAQSLKQELAKEKETFKSRMRKEKRRLVRETIARYKDLDQFESLAEEILPFDALFKRVNGALKLQQRADKEYGRISEIRQKLLRIELYLDEISRIYKDSVFIHEEIKRSKKILEKEKQRVLSLPRADRLYPQVQDHSLVRTITQQIELLDPSPKSLQLLKKLEDSIKEMTKLSVNNELTPILSTINRKKALIVRFLYDRFTSEIDPEGKIEFVEDLEQFVKSGQSHSFDLYIDAYNILLTVNDNKPISEDSLSEARKNFIKAVLTRSRFFNNVFLVFDGISSDRELLENVQIIYADRGKGENADEILIRLLSQRNDNKAILATADREIIEQTSVYTYATVEPISFFSFITERAFPHF